MEYAYVIKCCLSNEGKTNAIHRRVKRGHKTSFQVTWIGNVCQVNKQVVVHSLECLGFLTAKMGLSLPCYTHVSPLLPRSSSILPSVPPVLSCLLHLYILSLSCSSKDWLSWGQKGKVKL